MFDVVIIGAGAAGLMCAATAGQNDRKVLLLDSAESVGKKIRISGGGRCNFTNIHTTPKNFISENPHFCVSALKRYSSADFISLVKKHQIAFHEKTLGQLFCDSSAKEINEMLLQECADGNVEIRLESKVEKIQKLENHFEINVGGEMLEAKSLVIATGGPSIPKMGASDFGYRIARQFGLKIIEPKPALVPLTFEEKLLSRTKSLSGVALPSEVSFGKVKFREAILFTHRGVSGPVILQISSYVKKGDFIKVNFAPDRDVFAWLLDEKDMKPKQDIQKLLSQILPKSFAEFVVSEVGHSGYLADLSTKKLRFFADFVNAWRMEITGDEGLAKAEVTAGGLDTNEISSKTFEAKKVPGLFFIGEVLDVTGHLGGHNFQWAWASGKAAGEFI
jgi:predicted Rossmann fold flavoprotein